MAPKKQLENPSAQQFADNMWKTQDEVISALKKATEDMTHYYDKKQSKSHKYKVRDKAWLEGINISTECLTKKLGDTCFGPFKVIKKVGASSYQLNTTKMWKHITNVFNEALLSPYTPPTFPNKP